MFFLNREANFRDQGKHKAALECQRSGFTSSDYTEKNCDKDYNKNKR
jgi:hypothetical protein